MSSPVWQKQCAAPYQWGTSDAPNFGRGPVTTEGELWTAQAAVLLCY